MNKKMSLTEYVGKFRSIEKAAQAMDLPERTLRRWMKGETVPTGLYAKLLTDRGLTLP